MLSQQGTVLLQRCERVAEVYLRWLCEMRSELPVPQAPAAVWGSHNVCVPALETVCARVTPYRLRGLAGAPGSRRTRPRCPCV